MVTVIQSTTPAATATTMAGAESATGLDLVFSGEALNVKGLMETFQKQMANPAIVAAAKKVLQAEDLTPEGLRGLIKLEQSKDTNIVTVTARARTPQAARDLANRMAAEMRRFVEEANRGALAARAGQLEQRLRVQENYLTASIQDVQARLADTAPVIATRVSIVDTPFFQQAAAAQTGRRVSELSDLATLREEVNPAYAILSETLGRLDAQRSQVASQRAEIAALLSGERLAEAARLGGTVADVTSRAFLPSVPVAPRKVMNVAVAGVLGIMAGVFLVFVRKFLMSPDGVGVARGTDIPNPASGAGV